MLAGSHFRCPYGSITRSARDSLVLLITNQLLYQLSYASLCDLLIYFPLLAGRPSARQRRACRGRNHRREQASAFHLVQFRSPTLA